MNEKLESLADDFLAIATHFQHVADFAEMRGESFQVMRDYVERIRRNANELLSMRTAVTEGDGKP